MSQHAAGTSETSTGLVPATLAAVRRGVGRGARRRLSGVTLLLGLLPAVAIMAAAPAPDRTFVGLAGAVQLLMSVALPCIGVLLARDVLRSPGTVRVIPTLLGATVLAVAAGAYGVIVCAVVLLVAPSATEGRWDHAAGVVVGSVLVQVVAQLVGTGLGLLLRLVVVACLATLVLPLGLWLVLGAVDVLQPAQAWLTPYAAAQNLLSGQMTALAWVQWLAVALLWGAALNSVGVARLRRPVAS